MFRGLLVMLAITIPGTALTGDAAGLRDPTRPAGWQAMGADQTAGTDSKTAALQFQGVFNRDGVRTALISGRRVAVGDRVHGAEVIEIENHRVILIADGERLELVARVSPVKSPIEAREVMR